jgi:type II secretory pathway component PulM
MAKISRLAKEVKEIKASAPEVIAKDNAYQQVVLQSYLANFSSTNKEIEA